MRAAFCLAWGGLVSGCAASHRPDLPTFSYNNRPRNALIVNRRPYYGNGQPDGCVVGAQFALALRPAAGDSLVGQVTDTRTGQPVFYATATLVGASATTLGPVLVGTTGSFTFSRTQRVRRITLSAIGYRTLTVDIQPIAN